MVVVVINAHIRGAVMNAFISSAVSPDYAAVQFQKLAVFLSKTAFCSRCICGFLKDKVRILITHHIQYLKSASKVLVLGGVSKTVCYH